MAGIDKIYCYSKRDFESFWNWCVKFDDMCKKDIQLSLLDYFYTDLEHYDKTYSSYTSGVPITDFPEVVDMWLLKHCPVQWVRDYILYVQYKSIRLRPKDIELYIDRG